MLNLRTPTVLVVLLCVATGCSGPDETESNKTANTMTGDAAVVNDATNVADANAPDRGVDAQRDATTDADSTDMSVGDLTIADATTDLGSPDAQADAVADASDMVTSDAADVSTDAAPDADAAVVGPDTCPMAEMMVLNAMGVGSASGSFVGMTDSVPTSQFCPVAAGGADAFYTVEIPVGSWDVKIDTIGSTADTVLSIGFDCQQLGSMSPCNDDHDANQGSASRIWLHNVATPQALTLHIAVDSTGPPQDYVVNVELRPAAPDACASIVGAAPLDITGGGTVVGIIDGLFGAVAGSCQPVGSTGPEAVFQIDPSGTTIMNLQALSSDFVPDLHVRTNSCGLGLEIGCNLGSSSGAVAGASLSLIPSIGAQHYVFVEGATGSYVLNYAPF